MIKLSRKDELIDIITQKVDNLSLILKDSQVLVLVKQIETSIENQDEEIEHLAKIFNEALINKVHGQKYNRPNIKHFYK